MRIDIVSIFPDYLAPLRLSLVGKAIADGIIDLHVHDLRDAATDRHRSVDDEPYGGGPGMVMSPEPWGRILDPIVADDTLVVVPTPSGRRFDQRTASSWARRRHLVFACGRYEGIDARVMEHYAGRADVAEVGIGDYVLAGGEAAALVMVEAVARLLPGVVGNADSIEDDSFSLDEESRLVEGPVYTRPPVWRELAVPDVLLSGHHGAIRQWREQQARDRTQRMRPDLLPGPPQATNPPAVAD